MHELKDEDVKSRVESITAHAMKSIKDKEQAYLEAAKREAEGYRKREKALEQAWKDAAKRDVEEATLRADGECRNLRLLVAEHVAEITTLKRKLIKADNEGPFPCRVCGKTNKEPPFDPIGVICQCCNSWYHSSCIPKVYNQFYTEQTKRLLRRRLGGERIVWACGECGGADDLMELDPDLKRAEERYERRKKLGRECE